MANSQLEEMESTAMQYHDMWVIAAVNHAGSHVKLKWCTCAVKLSSKLPRVDSSGSERLDVSGKKMLICSACTSFSVCEDLRVHSSSRYVAPLCRVKQGLPPLLLAPNAMAVKD